jgi:hypothetical protein
VRFFEHPLIDSLFRGTYTANLFDGSGVGEKFKGTAQRIGANRNLPAYIPPTHFAAALLDVVAPVPPPADGTLTFEEAKKPASRPFARLSRIRTLSCKASRGPMSWTRTTG